ncbi:MAG TPA: FecR domain-containing protein, partial [Pirellulaceae bacterium]|nr:FecR domain-containing protein [Pirellulaceae bacterium]
MDEHELKIEVLELTLACQRDDATAEQRARLERLLADEPRAIVWYLRVVDDTLTLRAAAAALASNSSSDANSCQNVIAAIDLEQRESQRRTSRRPVFAALPPTVWWASVACLLLVAVGVPWWMSSGQTIATAASGRDSTSARVVSVTNVRWSDGAKCFSEWSFVHPGDVLQFETGLVSLFLSNGAEVLIEGPADVTFESLEKMFAREGKLAARVGPGAVGFRIETPHANVIDRGTAFGVSVDSKQRTGVVVYEGIVDLDVLGATEHPRRRLASGEGLSVNGRGELSRITTVESANFLEPPQARSAMADPARV